MLGAVDGITYPNEKLTLNAGDTIVMYTDGVNEAMNSDFQEYGDERMMKTLSQQLGKTCQEVIDGQLASLKDFVGNAEQSDDITILTLKRKA
jgi:sigma-B regulation protein RsbU (phosphoserine phosphatase)